MNTPKSEQLRIIAQRLLLLLLLFTLFFIFLILADESQLDNEVRKELFERTESFIYDIFNEEAEFTYEHYFTEHLKSNSNSEWSNKVLLFRESDLQTISEFTRLVKKEANEEFNVEHYIVELDLQLLVNGEEHKAKAAFIWGLQESEFYLYSMDFPVKIEKIPVLGTIYEIETFE